MGFDIRQNNIEFLVFVLNESRDMDMGQGAGPIKKMDFARFLQQLAGYLKSGAIVTLFEVSKRLTELRRIWNWLDLRTL